MSPYIRMMEEIRILIHKQSSTKHILNTYGGVMQNKIYCIYIMINIYILEYMLEYLIDEKKHTGANRVNSNLGHRINIQEHVGIV